VIQTADNQLMISSLLLLWYGSQVVFSQHYLLQSVVMRPTAI